MPKLTSPSTAPAVAPANAPAPVLAQEAPTILVVFGATGDLMERKIGPALHYLRARAQLPPRFRCVGMARRDIGDANFRESVRESVRTHSAGTPDAAELDGFAEMFSYSQGQFDDPVGYGALVDVLNGIDDEWGVCANKLFYLAVPPKHYRTILEHLAGSGLTAACGGEGGWTRVLVEKPFGKDVTTSRELDELLGTLFDESQIYRIDHYLAKEMLQGIMSFRFSNNLLEPVWDARGVERIEIDLLETLDAEGRGAFYDGVGALRDVGQNHLLQMLALVTMAQPLSADAPAIRAERVSALRALVPMKADEVRDRTFRAQYEGFRDVEGVAPDSDTETYFEVTTTLDSPAWAGVPVVLRGGKGLGTVSKQVTVTLRHPSPCLCEPGPHISNKVIFRIEPTESISISFRAKKPGFANVLEEREFDFFLHEKEEKAQYVEEYAKLLADAIEGDQRLFVSTREVRAMWEFIDPIVAEWARGDLPLAHYVLGSDDVLGAGESAVAAGPPLGAEARSKREIGVVGLGRMGAGIARNLLGHGWRVVGFNRTPGVAARMSGYGLEPVGSLAELVGALTPPRTVWLMVPAGAPVDAMLFGPEGLAGLLAPGDTVIDGGNSCFSDDPGRASRLAEEGIRFLDVGTSGGPDGAATGACLMVGGDRTDFDRLRPLWEDLSVKDGFRFFAGHGGGHFVKMVHNGIEYGMMQAIAEGFTVMHASEYSLDLTDAADVFNHGSVIESRLVAWLTSALRLHGEDLEGVSGTVGQTGEGSWTVEEAHRLGVQVRVIEGALEFRRESQQDPDWTGKVLSGLREQFGRHPAK